MEIIRNHYLRDYKPNTRETIRRQTLHQFADAGLIVHNPDDPDRPVNSPKSCYQITTAALEVIQKYGTSESEVALEKYLAAVPGLRAQYAVARGLHRIPVTLADGSQVTLSPVGKTH